MSKNEDEKAYLLHSFIKKVGVFRVDVGMR